MGCGSHCFLCGVLLDNERMVWRCVVMVQKSVVIWNSLLFHRFLNFSQHCFIVEGVHCSSQLHKFVMDYPSDIEMITDEKNTLWKTEWTPHTTFTQKLTTVRSEFGVGVEACRIWRANIQLPFGIVSMFYIVFTSFYRWRHVFFDQSLYNHFLKRGFKISDFQIFIDSGIKKDEFLYDIYCYSIAHFILAQKGAVYEQNLLNYTTSYYKRKIILKISFYLTTHNNGLKSIK